MPEKEIYPVPVRTWCLGQKDKFIRALNEVILSVRECKKQGYGRLGGAKEADPVLSLLESFIDIPILHARSIFL